MGYSDICGSSGEAKPLVDALKKVVKDLTLRVIKLVEEVKEAKQLANRE